MCRFNDIVLWIRLNSREHGELVLFDCQFFLVESPSFVTVGSSRSHATAHIEHAQSTHRGSAL